MISILCLSDETLLAQCFPVFQELRHHLTDLTSFVAQVKKQQQEGYQIATLSEDRAIVACIGYRAMTALSWGSILYIDDLIVTSSARGKGYGEALLFFIKEQAEQKGCAQIHLDTGYHRHRAHRLYLKLRFELHCHHLALGALTL